MLFCTTCARTYGPDEGHQVCPYDGTPLFDMAGGEAASASAETAAPVASGPASFDDEPPTVEASDFDYASVMAQASPAPVPKLASTPEPEPDDDPFAAMLDGAGSSGKRGSKIISGDVEDPFASRVPAVGEDFGLPGMAGAGLGNPFSDASASAGLGNPFSDASQSMSGASSASASSMSAGLDDPFSQPMAATPEAKADPFASYVPAAQRLDDQHPAVLAASELDLPEADDAASIRIAADIKKTLNEFGSPGDEPLELGGLGEEFVPTRPSYTSEAEHEALPSARQTRPGGGGSKLVPILAALILLIGAGGAGWYFTMGPGATPSQPSNTNNQTTAAATTSTTDTSGGKAPESTNNATNQGSGGGPTGGTTAETTGNTTAETTGTAGATTDAPPKVEDKPEDKPKVEDKPRRRVRRPKTDDKPEDKPKERPKAEDKPKEKPKDGFKSIAPKDKSALQKELDSLIP